MTFQVAKRDYAVMAKALKVAGLDEAKSHEVVDALFKDKHMLIDSGTYSDLYICANTHGPAS